MNEIVTVSEMSAFDDFHNMSNHLINRFCMIAGQLNPSEHRIYHKKF